MKRKTTKEIIADSFVELAASKAINKISIIDIVENCSVTKPTFYRYFKDKYDLISWIYVREAQDNVDKIGDGGYLWRDTLLEGATLAWHKIGPRRRHRITLFFSHGAP